MKIKLSAKVKTIISPDVSVFVFCLCFSPWVEVVWARLEDGDVTYFFCISFAIFVQKHRDGFVLVCLSCKSAVNQICQIAPKHNSHEAEAEFYKIFNK